MASTTQHPVRPFGINRPVVTGAVPPQQTQRRRGWGTLGLLAITFILTVAAQSAHAQVYRVLHDFTNGADGEKPYSGLIMDRAGNLYGTAAWGPAGGAVFQMSYKSSHWILTPLYEFTGGDDGNFPNGVVFGPDGSLYGTTYGGGINNCVFGTCGTVFRLTRPPTSCRAVICYWTETVLYRFAGGSDGGTPESGSLVFDQAGNLYGTTAFGGGTGCVGGCGTVFELMPTSSGWVEHVLYRFTGGSDGATPIAGLTMDQTGKLYGTTESGGNLDCVAERGLGCGTAFQLTPLGNGWTETPVYSFLGESDGYKPYAGVIFNRSGNLYGATTSGGSGGGGTVFELVPSNGSWAISTLYSLSGAFGGPFRRLAMDAAGNLYGTAWMDSTGYGAIFKLTHSGQSWIYSSLHNFTGGTDGGVPICTPVFDSSGNIYGTASQGGAYGDGVVWEITP